MTPASDNAVNYIRRLAEEHFWGTISIKLQDGEVIHVTEERSLKPNQLIPEHRRTHGISQQ
jgi:hypothetical protein